MNVADVLDSAADKIERDGWCQGSFYDVRGRVCMLGAIGMAQGCRAESPGSGWTGMHRDPAIATLERALDGGIPDFNDAPGRTAAEVVAMLRAVAMSERARVAAPEREGVSA